MKWPSSSLRHRAPSVFALSVLALIGVCASIEAIANTQPAPPEGAAVAPPAKARPKPPTEVRTRNAVFKLASYDDLPGWRQDDMRSSWGAFRNSCDVLQKRDDWDEICAAAKTVPPSTRAMRSFFENRFTLLRILNTDATREGDVTGYFEPLLEGQPQRDAEFSTPVIGVPRDLFTIDWSRIPRSQRRGVVRVNTDGNLLLVAEPGETAAYTLDLRRFVLDDRDRRLRVRLVGAAGSADAHAEPYYTRGEMVALGMPLGVDAPVLIWVNDPLALYAMQVQGSGRVRLPDGQILRLQYAEQNGHPFRPLRVRAKERRRIATRGLGDTLEPATEFEIEGEALAGAAGAEPQANTGLLTRGGGAVHQPAPVAAADVDPLVEELLKGARKRAPVQPTTTAAKPTQAAKPRSSLVADRLSSDPSYVFFMAVADRPQSEGPQGALGVPLTPGRSVAVDPRVTPLGYPVFLSAPAPAGSSISMQRLMFAQDTGGAIRGAVRADYFWGFGNEAGQMARSTRHRGEMWVLLPTAEASRLTNSALVTRGAAPQGEAESSCLIPDGEFCVEPD